MTLLESSVTKLKESVKSCVNMPKTELLHLRHNVHDVCGTEVVRIHADMSKEIYDYLFMHVIAYTHGARQAIITFFFQRFYEECIEQGIKPVWDEENGPRIVAILNRMNFTPVPEPKVKKLPKHVRESNKAMEATGRAE